MNPLHKVVGGRGHDDEGIDVDSLAFALASPMRPEAGKEDRCLVLVADRVGLALAFPLVEVLHRDQAALGLHRPAVTGFFGHFLGLGVEGGELQLLERLLEPGRHQSEACERAAVLFPVAGNDGRQLGWGDVVGLSQGL